jgi:adenylate cyclase
VQAVLAARIDRLHGRDKAVLEAAAVIGREFSEPVLQRVIGLDSHELLESLGRLCAAELLFEQAVYPVPQYVFKHPLTEEVAYRTQLSERRTRFHAAAAAALAEMDPDRLDEIAGLVSNHWEQAREPVQAAHWGARAAIWAGQSHPADALRHWRRVRTLLQDAHDDPEAAGLALGASLWILQFGWRQGLSDDEVETVWREGTALAERTGNTWAKTALYGSHALSRGMVGAVSEALEHSLEGLRLARELHYHELELSGGTPYWMSLLGETTATIDHLTERIERMGEDYDLGRQVVGFSTLIWSTFFLGLTLAENGRIDEARTTVDRAVRLAREHDDVESLGWAHTQYAMTDYFSGEVRDGLEHVREGAEIAERIGSPFSRVIAYCVMGYGHLARGEWIEAIEVEEEALRIMSASRTGLQYEPLALAAVAEAQLGLGDTEGARASAERGADVAAREHMRRFEAQCRVILGRALSRSQPTEAGAELDRALELIGDDFVSFVPRVSEARADLHAMHGRAAARDQLLREALSGYERIGAHGHARRVRDRLAGRVGTAVD